VTLQCRDDRRRHARTADGVYEGVLTRDRGLHRLRVACVADPHRNTRDVVVVVAVDEGGDLVTTFTACSTTARPVLPTAPTVDPQAEGRLTGE